MNREMKRVISKYFFTTGVISCIILLFCGCITASQRSAYNAYLTRYSVISMKSEGESLKMQGFEKDINLQLPGKEQTEKLRRCMRFSPFASVVFFGECLEEMLQSFSD